MKVTLSSTARISEAAVFRELEGESVILNLQSGRYFGLDPVGTRIWELIAQFGQLSAVRDAIIKEFDAAPEEVCLDLVDLVTHLQAHGLVEVEP